jgi:hypothetical protein
VQKDEVAGRLLKKLGSTGKVVDKNKNAVA